MLLFAYERIDLGSEMSGIRNSPIQFPPHLVIATLAAAIKSLLAIAKQKFILSRVPEKYQAPSLIHPISKSSFIRTSHCDTALPFTMAPSRTSTVKSKHATNKSGIKNSKASTKSTFDGVSKPKSEKSKRTQSKGVSLKTHKQEGGPMAKLKRKRRVFTEKELDIPALNMITPIGVEKPKGKKKGKVFVDDRVCLLYSLCRD